MRERKKERGGWRERGDKEVEREERENQRGGER